jgi:hypothetical protein
VRNPKEAQRPYPRSFLTQFEHFQKDSGNDSKAKRFCGDLLGSYIESQFLRDLVKALDHELGLDIYFSEREIYI